MNTTTADYLMQNTNNLTLVIIADNENMYQKPQPMKNFKLGAARPVVQANPICLFFKYLCNVPMLILQVSFVVLLMARINSLKASDPAAARIMQGQISWLLAAILVVYNFIILITDCCFDGTKTDTTIKCCMQIIVFGGIGISAWYALVCYQIFA